MSENSSGWEEVDENSIKAFWPAAPRAQGRSGEVGSRRPYIYGSNINRYRHNGSANRKDGHAFRQTRLLSTVKRVKSKDQEADENDRKYGLHEWLVSPKSGTDLAPVRTYLGKQR